MPASTPTSDIIPFLRIRSAYGAVWLDGGERLAFLGDQTGIPQAYVMRAGGGWPDQITFESERVSGLAASPDGATLLFARDTGGDERHTIFSALPERPLTAADAIHVLGAFSPDGRLHAFTHTERNGTDFDLAVVDLKTGERRELAPLEGYHDVTDWGPRGILLERAHSNVASDLLLVDPETGAVEQLTRQSGQDLFTTARFEREGTILCTSNHDSQFARLARLAPDGTPAFLTEDDADVEQVAISHDGRVALIRNRNGYAELLVDGDLVGGLPEGTISSPAFSPDGTRLACTVTPPDAPPDVWVVEGSSVRRVTRAPLGGLTADRLLRPELHHFESFDGLRVPYLLYGPSDAPTLCHVHGGPESQARPALNPIIQYFASRGIAVAVPNVRGSTGYGRTYVGLDDIEKRGDSVRDLAELARVLGAERGVPVAVMGGSYGGYMTLAAITEYPELWRAAVDVVGIANLVTFLENTGSYRRKLREAEYGSLEHDRALLERLSPIHKIDRIVAPLMVIHGARDPRVPVSEAEQIVGALRARGREVEYLRYEDEGHGLVRLANRIDAYPRVAAFLEAHLL